MRETISKQMKRFVSIKCAALILAAAFCGAGFGVDYHALLESSFRGPSASVRALIESAAAHSGLPSIVLAAVANVESGFRADAVNFHPQLVKYFPHKDPAERRMQASSIGLMQVVYGFHKKRCSLQSWRDLLDPATNLKCSAMILASCMDAQAKQGTVERIRGALTCYNGSPTYPDKIFRSAESIAVADNRNASSPELLDVHRLNSQAG